MRIAELLIVCGSILLGSVVASANGDNYGSHDAVRAAKGAGPGALVILAYRTFRKDEDA